MCKELAWKTVKTKINEALLKIFFKINSGENF